MTNHKSRVSKLEAKRPAPGDKKYYIASYYADETENPNGYKARRMAGAFVWDDAGRISKTVRQPKPMGEEIQFNTRAELEEFGRRPDVDLFSVVVFRYDPQQTIT